MSQICGMLNNPGYISQETSGHHFSPIVPPLAARGLPRGCGRERHLAARVGTIRNTEMVQ
jgi:hypothetical protein